MLIQIFLCFYSFPGFSQADSGSSLQLISEIERLNDDPVRVLFSNNVKINNKGGHIQGIQLYKYNQKEYYFLSGSSDQFAYYAVVKTGDENRIISVSKLMEKPFKHAGGFQISGNLLAIGIEDNDARNRSKVFVYSLNDPEKPLCEPLAVIDRNGPVKRSTAGCTAITIIKDKVLLVVGDWNTENLDFYIIDHQKLGTPDEVQVLVYSIELNKADRTGWIDARWLPYQNINFLKDDSGSLYLAGMASDEKNENVTDIYRLQTDDFSSFRLQKIHSLKFRQNKEFGFVWGAGIYQDNNFRIKVISSGQQIVDNSVINIFE